MAAPDFPASPTVGQTYTAPSGIVYTWDGKVWTTTSTPQNAYWTDTGTALTPTDGTKNLSVPSGVLYQGFGSRAVAVANLYQNSVNEVGVPGQDTTRPAWRWNGNATAGQDNFAVARAPANTTGFVQLFQLDNAGNAAIPGTLTQNTVGAQMTRTTDLILTTGAVASVPFDTAVINRGSCWVAGTPVQFNLTIPGAYIVAGMFTFSNTNTTGSRLVSIVNKAGTTLARHDIAPALVAWMCAVVTCMYVSTDPTDYIGFQAMQSSGGNLNLVASQVRAFVWRLGN